MKKLTIAFAILLILVGCDVGVKQPGKPEDTTKQGIVATHEPLQFQFHEVRTNYLEYQDDIEYPMYSLITSKEELAAYLETNQKIFDFSTLDQEKTFDESFFDEHSLILVALEENSGSNRHDVKEVFINDGVITVKVERIVAEMGTADMAQWHLVVVLDKEEVHTSRLVVDVE